VKLGLSEKQVNTFLFAAEGIGAAFVGIFLAAYLAGIPTTAVFHSEPAFRIPLTILGIILLVMVLSAFVLSAVSKKK
jgi:F0F1-type ATP synthase assembly protein I